MTIEHLINTIKKKKLPCNLDMVRLAYDFAEEAHKGQRRKNGEPYINHPLHTAMTLVQLKMDEATIIAALLHDAPEDTKKTLDDIRKNFGDEVAILVEGVTKLGKLKYRGLARYVENLRKMFVAMAQDIRVIFIKFADRLHNLKTLNALPRGKQKRIAQETLEIYAPIANRLGMSELKSQLEDLSFKYLESKEYKWITDLIKKDQEKRKEALEKTREQITKDILGSNIKIVSIFSRRKATYSLYKKLLSHERDINRIYDVIALRIVVPTIEDCYGSLGIIHNRYKPLQARFKDYISQPKPNGYQSLHTTIFAEIGSLLECQIRTSEMHRQAEYGIAAHWHYDEHGSIIPSRKIKWVDELIKIQEEIKEGKKYLESLKIDVLRDRIFVFTPKGDVIDLPEGSTPIDFAYHIHTELGDKCIAAKINEHIAPIDTILKSGDMVEIVIDKNKKGPSEGWLKFVKTTMARAKIRQKAKKSLWAKFDVIGEVRKKIGR